MEYCSETLIDFVTPGTGLKPYSSGIVSNGGAERLRSREGDFKVELEEEVGERIPRLEEDDEPWGCPYRGGGGGGGKDRLGISV